MRFRGEESDGHAHHRAVGMAVRRAVEASPDRDAFPELMGAGLLAHEVSLLLLHASSAESVDVTIHAEAALADAGIGYDQVQQAFDNPFKALEYELNRDEHLEVQQTTARDDAFAAGELWKDGALGTLTQIRRAEVKDDTAKTAALIDSVKTTKGLEDLQQQFQKRYDKPMIEAPDLADFEMRAHLAKLEDRKSVV